MLMDVAHAVASKLKSALFSQISSARYFNYFCLSFAFSQHLQSWQDQRGQLPLLENCLKVFYLL